jgi:UDP-N-acetylglucosamine 2-epimerase (non-hydrolysing)
MSDIRKPTALVVFGTRPETIKVWPVIRALRERRDQIDTIICSTGQHRELLTPVLKQLAIEPDISLEVFGEKQSLEATFSKVLTGLGTILARHRPDVVIVQGDVTTSIAAAVASMQYRIRVAHIEAGLRTKTKWSPWPEEIHRRVIGQIAEWHFAPTKGSEENLLREGIPASSIAVVGNTGIDTLLHTLRHVVGIDPHAKDRPRDKRVLVTFHRRELDEKARHALVHTFARLADEYTAFEFVCPIHPSLTGHPAFEKIRGSKLKLVTPIPYVDFIKSMATSSLIITDSGGVQEEAAAVGTPTLVVRDESCRPEGIEAGVAKLVGTEAPYIESQVRELLSNPALLAQMARPSDAYGDGNAAMRIVDRLIKDLSQMEPL